MNPLAVLRKRNPGSPLWKILLWEVSRGILWVILTLLYRLRSWGVRNIPNEGPVLLLCNHQSVLDLSVIGVPITHRHYHPMARKTLFKNPWISKLMKAYNAFEVDQEKSDIRSIRTAVDHLKNEQLLMLFPEGSRTPDGRVHEFQPGLMLLIRRAKPTVVTAAIEGNFDIMPIGAKRPRLRGRAYVKYSPPIPAEQLINMPPDQALTMLRDNVEQLRMELRQQMRRDTNGKYPLPSPADQPLEI